MSIDWLTEAERAEPELTALRHAFHRCPEIGNREFLTAARIEDYLRGCGIETKRLLGTAVVGRLRGAVSGPVAALRADMDALPVQEATGAAFASEVEGMMHACGHDVHITAALGAAKLLAGHRHELPGSVVFLFQPDEEGGGGARRMIDEGVLEGVDAVFGCHVSPDLPLGHVGIKFGKFYAASDLFDLTLTGKSAHGAEREKGVDALAAAAELVGELLSLPERTPEARSVVSIGTLAAGTARNIVAETAELSGILRTLGPENRIRMRSRIEETVRSLAARTGVRAELRLRESYPGIVNDESMTRLAGDAAEALLGPGRVHVLSEPTMATEDFGCFLQERPGSFTHIGAGCTQPLHSSAFLPDDRAAVIAAALHARLVSDFLSRG
ncbi:MAG: amidohydrolase [Oscillospiraceae bacterium]|nr:amidohydrolase [Oscillospiraceae bacterium]